MDHSGVQIEKAANSLEVDSNLVQTPKAERMVTYDLFLTKVMISGIYKMATGMCRTVRSKLFAETAVNFLLDFKNMSGKQGPLKRRLGPQSLDG